MIAALAPLLSGASQGLAGGLSDSGSNSATATGTFGDFRGPTINFGGQVSALNQNWLLIGGAIVAVVWLLRK